MLSRKAKYAINALVYLANENKEREPIQISKISESENIPRKFLEAILLDMRNAGILQSRKGKFGGYYLQKKPSEINIAMVMRLFDGPIAMLPCIASQNYERCEECLDEATCGIRDVFSEVRLETLRILHQATLEDIIRRSKTLAKQKPYSRKRSPADDL